MTIKDDGGSSATASSTARVADAPLTAEVSNFTPTEGLSYSGTVAIFFDNDAYGTTSDYTATIDWGDGSPNSAGTISQGGGGFTVQGNHTYQEESPPGTPFKVSVTISDVGGSTTSASFSIKVADAALTSRSSPSPTATQGVPFSGTVGTFADADPGGASADYTATVNWGDGGSSPGTIVPDGSGFDVQASYTFVNASSKVNSLPYTVTVNDAGGSTVQIAGSITIIASEPTAKGSDCPILSSAGVQYDDGSIGLQAGGLTYTNADGYDSQSDNGTGFVNPAMPSLQQGSGGDLMEVASADNSTWFQPTTSSSSSTASGSAPAGASPPTPPSYTPMFGAHESLVADPSGDLIVTDAQGIQTRYHGFDSSVPAGERGQLIRSTDPNGNVTSVTSLTPAGRIAEIQSTTTTGGNTTVDSYSYTYYSSGPGVGLVQEETFRTQVNGGPWATVRQTLYTYYNGVEPNGNQGDLKTTTEEDGSGNLLDETYYRYYVAGEANGYQHGLKYALDAQAFARASAAVGDPTTVSDATLATYATDYFQYDTYGRITEAVIQGAGCSCNTQSGAGTYTYSYQLSGNPDGLNTWKSKTTETLPDGNQNVVYVNYAGEVVASAFVDVNDKANPSLSGKAWVTYYAYDAQGKNVLTANPSAVTIQDPSLLNAAAASNPDIVGYSSSSNTYKYLAANSGVINLTDFGAATTGTATAAGDAAGYVKDEKIQDGYAGTPILQDTRQYFSQTSTGGATIYPLASATAYRNADGTGAETTSYAYTWYPGTDAVQMMTTTAPVVSASQNGPGVADVTSTYYDTYGQVVWSKDADGYLQNYQYDNATGAVTKSIDDVDLSQSAQYTNLPSAWTPATLPAIVDDSSGAPSFTTVGSWTPASSNADYAGSLEYAAAASGGSGATSQATWQVGNLAPGTYDAEVTWSGLSNRADNAPFQVYDGNTLLATILVNQKLAPVGTQVPSGSSQIAFQSLGMFPISSGTLRVVLGNNADGYVIADAVRVAVPAVTPDSPLLIDDSQASPAFSTTGSWTSASSTADYNGTLQYSKSSTGAVTGTATWQSGSLASGTYDVQITWSASTNRADNAIFQVFDGSTPVGAVAVNQKVAPSGTQFGGMPFFDLGTYKVTSGTLRVVLSNNADGYVIADAVRISVGSPVDSTNLVTQTQDDALGRPTETVDPNGNVTYYVYDDPDHEVRIYRDWNASQGAPTLPTEVIREDWANGYTETLTMTAAPTLTNGVPNGQEAISNVQSLTRTLYDLAQRPIETDDYFNLSGITYQTTPQLGTAGANYYATKYGYDERGRQDLVQDANGTYTIVTFDGLGRQVGTYVGTNDTNFWAAGGPASPSNMTLVSQSQYDNNGVGDGNLTTTTLFPDANTSDNRVTAYAYDWRDRLVGSKSGVQATEDTSTNRPIAYYDLDNLGEVIAVSQYDGDGVALTSSKPDPTLLRAYGVTSFDDQGRPYQVRQYDVNQATGSVSATALVTNDWYDHRGDLIAESAPGGEVTKDLYDGSGRVISESVTDGAGGTSWTAAGSLNGDHVLTQTLTTYDADGNPILTATKDRFDSDTSADTGALGSPTSGPNARVYYAANYYDAADRLTASVDVGTNGGLSYIRPYMPPPRADTALVTSNTYNAAGLLQQSTDPRGIVSQSSYDALGRVAQSIAAYDPTINGGNPTASNNQTTQYVYDGLDHLTQVSAVMPAGSPEQTTRYIYGVGPTTGSALSSNDLLSLIEYPDPATGSPSSAASNQQSWTYNALGDAAATTDPNGSAHAYAYDVLGRPVSDSVTTVGAGVDGAVRRLATAYDTGDRPYLYTSYDAVSGGSIVNQVERLYNGLGQLTAEYQSNSGPVNSSSTPVLRYTYTEMAGGQNNSRLTTMTYPNGKPLDYVYNPGLDDAISRISSLTDDNYGTPTTVLESYKYLGLQTIVERAHPQPGVNLTYIRQPGDTQASTDGGDRYTGLDRFGRVIDQNWVNPSTGQAVNRFQYTYDRESNVLSRADLVDTALSQLYSYDSLNRLNGYSQGTLSNGAIANPTASQTWTLDALGNWTNVRTTTGGTAASTARTFNTQNQATSVSGGTAPTFDADGNTTSDSGETYVYDAWNRLVAAKSSAGATIATYSYDALGRRITESYPGSGTTNHLYYSPDWQVIEERQNGTAASEVTQQYVWSESGIDTMVLRDSYSGGVETSRLYDLQDANDNVMALVDASGHVQERYAYDPYGVMTVLSVSGTPVPGNTPMANWRYGYQGSRLDQTSGLYAFRFRDYTPTEGRWMERDPAGFAGGSLDLYEFVDGSPIDQMDPLGLGPVSWVFTGQWDPSQNVWDSSMEAAGAQYAKSYYEVAPNASLILSAASRAPGPAGWLATGANIALLNMAPEDAPADGPVYAAAPGPRGRPVIIIGRPGPRGPQPFARPSLPPAPPISSTPPTAGAGRMGRPGVRVGQPHPRPPRLTAGSTPACPAPDTPVLPDSYWTGREAPKWVVPGPRRVVDMKPSSRSKGEVYTRITYYDKYGRLYGQSHLTSHGEPDIHPNPHHHRWDPVTGQQLKNPETGRIVWPGMHPAEGGGE